MTAKKNKSKYFLPKDLDSPRFTRGDLDDLLVFCARNKASDITFQSNEFIVADIDGKFNKINSHKLNNNELEEFATKLYRSEGIRSKIKGGDDSDGSYDIQYTRFERYRFRYNITAIESYGTDAIQITCRTIDALPPELDKLGVEQEIIDNIKPRQGIVAVVGPTGSGKSTLLAATIRSILEEPDGNRKILTYESPIEYVYDDVEAPTSIISQSEVPKHIPSFAAAVRNSLRRKPDVILIGESRDAETIGESITASMTGHALYTTVHSNGVAETINRMVNAFKEGEKNARAMDLISSLQLIVAQNLLPSLDGRRVAIREYLVFTPEITEFLLESGVDNLNMAARKVLREHGKTFYQSAKERFDEGLISEETLAKIKRSDKGVEMDMQDIAKSNIQKAKVLEKAKDFGDTVLFSDEEIPDDYDFQPFTDPDLEDSQ